MAIVWDTLLAASMARELDRTLRGRRARAVHFDRTEKRVLLFLRDATLVLNLNASDGTILLRAPQEPFPGARPLPATIKSVTTPPDERILIVALARSRGRIRRIELVVELLPNHRNVIFVEADTGTIRSVLHKRESADRRVAPGFRYSAPSPSGREGADGSLSHDRWSELFASVQATERRSVLLRSVAYSSRLNADWILGPTAVSVGASGSDPDADGDLWTLDAWRRWSSLAGLATAPGTEPAVEPCVIASKRGLQPYPALLPPPEGGSAAALDATVPEGGPAVALHATLPEGGPAVTLHATLLEAFDAVAAAEGGGAAEVFLPPDLLAQVQETLRTGAKALKRLQRELERTGDPAAIRRQGDLLLARLQEVPRNADRVTLLGFESEAVELTLDPRRSASDNAQAFYREAARAQRARERLPGMIARAQAEEARLREALEQAHRGEIEADELGGLLGGAGARVRGTASGPSLPYRTFTSSGGIEIRVGRGARTNDDLTFHHARPNDVWLHARHASGAHVVLRWDGSDNPPQRDLEEAAVLAALNSKARGSKTVPVDWTRRKYVRKPRKSPPGTVLLERAKTVFVEPDPGLPERLRAERP